MYLAGIETDKTHTKVGITSGHQAGLGTRLILPQVMPTSPMLPILIPFAGLYARPTLLVTSVLLRESGEEEDL
jgi:hypothetical protein